MVSRNSGLGLATSPHTPSPKCVNPNRLRACCMLLNEWKIQWGLKRSLGGATILSNKVKEMSFPAGSNQFCTPETTQRVRKEWRRLSAEEQSVLIYAFEAAIETNRFQAFVDYHSNPRSAFQSHATCAFALWHRRFLLAMEDMLRDIDPPRTSCITIPYWDISVSLHRQEKQGGCFSVASCAAGLFDDMLGGVPGLFSDDSASLNLDHRNFGKLYVASGILIQGRPVTNLQDDMGRSGLVRNDLLRISIPLSADSANLADMIVTNTDYDSFTRTLQRGLHDEVHSIIGGFMPTFVSPVDVFFWVWHSTIDYYMNLWQACHFQDPNPLEFMGNGHCEVRPLWSDDVFAAGGPPPEEYPEGISLQPASIDLMIMEKKEGESTRLISADPKLGRYFENSTSLEFLSVADVRSMPQHSRFAYELIDEEQALWKSLWGLETSKCSAITYGETPSMFTKSNLKNKTYPYQELDALIDQWILNLLPSSDYDYDDEEEPNLNKRRQFLSCCVLHTRGTITSLPAWESFTEDFKSRRDYVRGAPNRCLFLWPGEANLTETAIPTETEPSSGILHADTQILVGLCVLIALSIL